jgi:hypothetical protein
MTVSGLPALALLGLSAALVALAAVAVSNFVASEGAAAPVARPVPPIDAEAPQATQTATFATG